MIEKTTRLARRIIRRLRGTNERCVTLPPLTGTSPCGRVLFSYIIDAALAENGDALPHSHPHFWETWAMIQCFREEGYTVDAIHWTRRGAIPRMDYDIYVDVRRNFDRFAASLPDSCLKIAHMDTAHHRVHNGNQRKRLDELHVRRGITLAPFKLVEENRAAEGADIITVLGNDFTRGTFAYAGKPIHRIHLSNAYLYDYPEQKNVANARNRYLWMGSEGFVHKGLDLVLEVFAGLPEYELIVCGPLDREPAFQKAFSDLLYHRPNIKAEGWVDIAGPRFRELTSQCLGMVYPSCSEGGGGCVITAMHAGLIPVVSWEASVDIHPEYGKLLTPVTVEAIQSAVVELSSRPEQELAAMSRHAWEWARRYHSRPQFLSEYRDFVKSLPSYLVSKRAGSLKKQPG